MNQQKKKNEPYESISLYISQIRRIEAFSFGITNINVCSPFPKYSIIIVNLRESNYYEFLNSWLNEKLRNKNYDSLIFVTKLWDELKNKGEIYNKIPSLKDMIHCNSDYHSKKLNILDRVHNN
ncbi:hypothetical protein POWCR01_000166800 [Plasmodium ovale]|uniref:PIR protein n=1 Tax=Plasmodium ovale TaxID=36330 RepID=A0A1C3KJ72_PLAOA|nr:hypothetical protein POWCR01_000166800 [Plasmodium ovale]